jgi:predicted TPR repeat methyltransferase
MTEDRQSVRAGITGHCTVSPDEALDLAVQLHRAGCLSEAKCIYEAVLAANPAHATALHFLGVLYHQEHLERLEYRAPRLVAEAIAARLQPEGSLAVLDAGCGTGLCGPLLRPFASRLIGVDLSSGMIEKARERGIYDDLVEAELTDWLISQTPQTYDVVACADILCYFGDLHRVLSAMGPVLRRGGLLVFTVESAEPSAAGFRIHPHGRYSHTGAHVSAALTGSSLSLLQIEDQILRLEGGTPVHGLVIAAIRD